MKTEKLHYKGFSFSENKRKKIEVYNKESVINDNLYLPDEFLDFAWFDDSRIFYIKNTIKKI